MNSIITLPPCPNEKVPAPEHPFHHITEIQPRFNDYDMFSHVNNSSYMQYLDVAKFSYFKAVTGEDVNMQNIGAVIVNINSSFYSPAYLNEPLAVVTACTRISRHSFTLEQRIFNPETGDVKCIAHSILAAFDPATATGCEMQPHWVQALTAFES